jgi:alkyl sulfatase BDS1-like metallo-beta-lactamase superfamily hydrolase
VSLSQFQLNIQKGLFEVVPGIYQARGLMGGSTKVIKEAQILADQGSYRIAATLLNKIVLSDKENKAAKELLGKTYEQLGFPAESGPWRNLYLTGALELRRGIDGLPAHYSDSVAMIKSGSLVFLIPAKVRE